MLFQRKFLGYYLFLGLFVTTVLYFFFNTNKLYNQDELYKFRLLANTNMSRYKVLSDSGSILIYKGSHKNLMLQINNNDFDQYSQLELSSLKHPQVSSYQYDFYYDKESQKAYSIEIGHDFNYNLLEFNLENRQTKITKIFEYPETKNFADREITINNQRFTHYFLSEKSDIRKKDGSIAIGFTKDFLNDFEFPDLISEYWYELETVLNENNIKLSKADVFEYINFFRRNTYYKYDNKYFENILPKHATYVGATNNDTELVFFINASRFIPSYLISVNKERRAISWINKIAAPILNIDTIDLNDDGNKQIVVGTYAPMYELPPTYFKEKYYSNTFESHLLIFDSDGSPYKINNLEINQKFEIGYKRMLFKKIGGFLYYCQFTNDDPVIKKMMKLNLSTAIVSETAISYHSVQAFIEIESGFVLIDKEDFRRHFIYFDKDMKFLKKITKEDFDRIIPAKDNTVQIEGTEYLQFMNHLYTPDLENYVRLPKKYYHIEKLGDNYLGISYYKDGVHNIELLELVINKVINLEVYLIFSLELILFLIFLIFRFITHIPLLEAHHSFFVTYTFLGFINTYKLKGQIERFNSLPQNFTIGDNKSSKYISDMRLKSDLIMNKNYFVIKVKIYTFGEYDILPLISRVSHELKGQLHILRGSLDLMKLDIMDSDVIDEKIIKIVGDCSNINEKVVKYAEGLVNLSRVNSSKIQKSNLKEIIEKIVFNYQSHIRIANLRNVDLQDDVCVCINTGSFTSALKNVIENAFDAINDSGDVNIILEKVNDTAVIKVSNSGYISDSDLQKIGKTQHTTKKNGTGVGVAISRAIIEKHSGSFDLICENNVVSAIIKLDIQE